MRPVEEKPVRLSGGAPVELELEARRTVCPICAAIVAPDRADQHIDWHERLVAELAALRPDPRTALCQRLAAARPL